MNQRVEKSVVRLRGLFEQFPCPSRSQIGFKKGTLSGSGAAAMEVLLSSGEVVKVEDNYYSKQGLPTEEVLGEMIRDRLNQTRKDEIVVLEESLRKWFVRRRFPRNVFDRAMNELVAKGDVFRMRIEGRSSLGPILIIHEEEEGKDMESVVRQLLEEAGGRMVKLSVIASQAGATVEDLHDWIGSNLNRLQLSDGDWASATDQERSFSFLEDGRKRLKLRFTNE